MRNRTKFAHLLSRTVFLFSFFFAMDSWAIEDLRGEAGQYVLIVESLDPVSSFFEDFAKLSPSASPAQREDALNTIRLVLLCVSNKQKEFALYASTATFPDKIDAIAKPLIDALSKQEFIKRRADLLADIEHADISRLHLIYDLFLILPAPTEEQLKFCRNYGHYGPIDSR